MKISIQKSDGSIGSFKTNDYSPVDICNKIKELQMVKFFVFTDEAGVVHCINTSEIGEITFSDYLKESIKTVLNEG